MRAPGFNADDEPWDAFGDEPEDGNAALEPLPCPFCGAEAVLDEVTGDKYPNAYGVECSNYKCGVFIEYRNTREQAIAFWNRRASAARERELQQRIAELEQKLARMPWRRIEESEPTEVCYTHYVPEAGDDASYHYQARISSDGFSLNDGDFSMLGDYEIVKIVHEEDEDDDN